jgi:hypothetical protein
MAAPSAALLTPMTNTHKISACNTSTLVIPAGIFLVYDSTTGLQRSQPAVRAPTTADTALKTYAGFSYTDANPGDVFDTLNSDGDTVVVMSNGTIAIDGPVTVSVASGKLGWATALGASAGLVLVGYAMTAGVDSQTMVVRLSITNSLP